MNNPIKVVGIVPARMGSSRFPGKPLAKIHGLPMIGHMYYRCKMSKLLDEVYINSESNKFAGIAKKSGIKFYQRP